MAHHDIEFNFLPKSLHKSVVRLTRERQNLTKSCKQLAQQISDEEAKLRATLEKLESLNRKLNALTSAHALSEEAFTALGDVGTGRGYDWRAGRNGLGGERSSKSMEKHGGGIGGRTGTLLLKRIEVPRKMTLAEHCKISLIINQTRAFTAQAEEERLNILELKQRLESLEQVLGRAEKPLTSELDRPDGSDTKSMCYVSTRRKPVPKTEWTSDVEVSSRFERNQRVSSVEEVGDEDNGMLDSISVDSSLPGQWPDDKDCKDSKKSPEDYFAMRGVDVFLLVWFMIILTFLSAR